MVICIQVVGFLVLVSGTSLYNELIRSCLPGMFDRLDDSDAEASIDPDYILLLNALGLQMFLSLQVCHPAVQYAMREALPSCWTISGQNQKFGPVQRG